jgi:hypothetical protein
MACPLASPQSLVGLQMVEELVGPKSKVSFDTWTLVATPVTILLTIACFFCLFLFYSVEITEVPYNPIPITKPTPKQIFVGVVSLITIVLWFIQPYVPLLGNGAIVAMIPFVIFFRFLFYFKIIYILFFLD